MHLITSALPYVNRTKHLGNLVGSLLPANVLARHLRLQGESVQFVCGTDEHGAAIEIEAGQQGLQPRALCDALHSQHHDVFQRFGLSFDAFGRTSDPAHHALTQHVFRRLEEKGLIDWRTIEQVYGVDDGRFLPDRFVAGTCPHCGSEGARGDQCDVCNRLLEPQDLVDPRSTVTGSTHLELRRTHHAFLRLSVLQPQVEAWVQQHQSTWPAITRQVTHSWLKRGLTDRCITRDLSWGVEVPGHPGKVFYVWFDAPLAYLSLVGVHPGDASPWDGAIRITQFLGKDNVPFHTVLFPAALLGSGVVQRLPHQIQATHWLDYYGQKFSTQHSHGIFLDQALELQPADYWRWGLLAQSPEAVDSSFTWDQFAHTVNKDLVGGLANFVHRLTQFTHKAVGDHVPDDADAITDSTLWDPCFAQLDAFDEALRGGQNRAAIAALRGLWSIGNHWIDQRAPWSNPGDRNAVVRTGFQLARLFVHASQPVIPSIASQLARRLGPPVTSVHHLDVAGQPFELGPPPLQRIEPNRGPEDVPTLTAS